MEELNQHEEEIMSLFWKQGELLIRDILEQLPDPKPPYTTLASTVRNLERKGYLSHRMYGTVNIYKPIISQEAYSKRSINRLVSLEVRLGGFYPSWSKRKISLRKKSVNCRI